MPVVVFLGSTEGWEAARDALAGVAEVRLVESKPEEVARALPQADALLDASMRVHITEAMIQAAPSLRVASCATTGSDHIDGAALARRGVPLRTLKEDGALLRDLTPAAELSWALLLACARRLKGAFRHVEQGEWRREAFPGIMLNGRVLGLIGCGRIGGWMARYAHAFHMRVLAFDPYQKAFPGHVTPGPLELLVEQSDFLSIHVPLNEETSGLLSRSLIERCKPGMVLVNTSRGAVLDETALLEALESGRISAAGLDVLTGEPDTGTHPLVQYARTHENLLITPHCGGFSPDAVRIVCAHAAKKIKEVLSNR